MNKKEMQEYQREYHQRRKNEPKYRTARLESRRKYEEVHREERRKQCRDYYKKNKHRWVERRQDPRQRSAHEKARWWVEKRKKRCEKCGKTALTVKHHEDYSKPTDVVFLCRSCHGRLHSKHGLCVKDSSSSRNG